jgi:hypothetical protein
MPLLLRPGVGLRLAASFGGVDQAPGAPLDRMAVEGAGRLLVQRILQIWRTDLQMQMWRSAPPRRSHLCSRRRRLSAYYILYIADSGPQSGLRGPGTRRTAPGDQRGLSIKVAVMHTCSGRSGGHVLKRPLGCRFYTPPAELQKRPTSMYNSKPVYFGGAAGHWHLASGIWHENAIYNLLLIALPCR